MSTGETKVRSQDEEDFLAEVQKVKDLLIKSNGFSDLKKPLSTNMTFALLAEFYVITRQSADREIDELKQAIEVLKNRPVMSYRGVWQKDVIYRHGDVTAYGGSAWHCDLDSAHGLQPGDGLGWKLMVKKGRDARDRA
ncbi:MAG: hypothetical protein EOR60_09600 [Mesorhizobium sp.]|nr:MAG: hypothetical protein EOR60_09600 [Mesorhizobium sp.]